MLRKRPFLLAALITAIFTGIAVGWIFARYSELPDIHALQDFKPPVVSEVYSDDNRLVGEFYDEYRRLLLYDEIPRSAIHAVLATEDASFFEHRGVRLLSIFRALIADIKARKYVQGGSTITQQLAKTLFLTPEKTFSRKIEEFLLALQLEIKFTKKELLTFYFNQMYFGESAFGIEAAANTYFGKNSSLLSTAESALLAGLLKSPSIYSPYKDPVKAIERRNVVLRRMFEEGYLTDQEFDSANAEKLTLSVPDKKDIAPHFMEYVKRQVEEHYGQNRIRTEGFTVYAGLNIDMQTSAVKAVERVLKEVAKRNSRIFGGENAPTLAGALVAIEPSTGQIKAFVGGQDYSEDRYNFPLLAKRPPGTAFLPFIYAAALENGKTASSMVVDSPIIIENRSGGDPWKPVNYPDKFHGQVPLMVALSNGLTVGSIKLFAEIKSAVVLDMARRLGIESDMEPKPFTAAGRSPVTLFEITKAYATLANRGLKLDPTYIKSIKPHAAQSSLRVEQRSEQVVSPQTSFIVSSFLVDATRNGIAKTAGAVGFESAAMAGNTENFTDAWFFGYTPDIVVGVWIGTREGNVSIGEGETGDRSAADVWREFMFTAYQFTGENRFDVPGNVVAVEFDYKTGLLSNPVCGKKVTAYYIKGTEPTEYCGE